MEPPIAMLQLILPTDKRNPCFTLYQTEDGQLIHVYYGVERLEVVPTADNHPAYRMLVARLYNAGVKVSALAELFDLDHKTIRSWGLALESGDPDALQRMLFGPPRKLTPAIKEFIASRWPCLLAEHCRNYRQVLQTEIKNYFGVSLSGESLRIIMNQITLERGESTELAAAAPDLAPPAETRADPPSGDVLETPEGDLFAPAKPPNPVGEPPVPESVASKCIPWCGQTSTLALVSPTVPSSHFKSTDSPTPESSESSELTPICEVVEVVTDPNFGEWTCFSSADGHADDQAPGEPETPASTHLDKPPEPVGEPPVPDWVACKFDPAPWQPPPGEATLCDHVGVMIFAHALASLPAVVDPPQPILGQWLAATLLGAHNIEQTKLLNWSDLGLLLGSVVSFPAPQRVVLGTLATPETVAAVLRWNFQQLGESVTQCNDFYLDPHTKHYTGMQRVLKGWCASIRWADKVMHGDFIHTAQGHPVYFEWVDNYDDLRVRFLPLIERMRATLGLDGTDPQAPPRTLTLTVDRGIFSNDLFNLVAADPSLHLITWEKGFTPGLWDPSRVTTRFAAERQRNNSRDVRLYQFSVIEQPWSRNPAIRQLIVLATNPKGKVAQLAILTDDWERPAEEIVWLIFNRWIQENDFKYIDKHMGMKQITSYKSIDYAELRGSLEDRQVPNDLFVQKTKEAKVITRRKSRLLLTDDTARRLESARQQEIAKLEAESTAPSKPLKALRQASQRSKRYTRARQEQLDALQLELDRIDEEKAALNKEVSRQEQLIEQQMVRMDTTHKTLMDAIKICARNLFYQALAPFKKLYDNNRDDHTQFRELTRCDGVLRLGPAGMEVHLLAPMHLAPKLRRIFVEVLGTINASTPPLPDGSGHKVCLRLTEKSRIKVQLSDDSDDPSSSV